MTLLAICQGNKCALVASDMMLIYLPDGQSLSPLEKAEKLISSKFRQNSNGDLLGYHGRLNSEEISHLYSMTLDAFLSAPVMGNPNFRDEQMEQLYLAYVSVIADQLNI